MDTTNTTPVVEETTVKTSKLDKFKCVALNVGLIGVPTAIGIASAYYSFRTKRMEYETAQLELEAAREEAAKSSK